MEVRWRIADGYYLYRHRTSVKADAAFTGATMALPKGKAYRDEFFRRRRNLPRNCSALTARPRPARARPP
ncbi:protein-disulfide reductase DsbD family protein [Klebsiella pneumoniae]|nr:protein-disulfide reductase DsbD family protein [Klebsiella pneumoniae]